MTTATIYALAGIVLVGIGLYRLVTTGDLLRRVVALNVASGGTGAVLVAAAYREPPGLTDPVPHALVITGIVVVVSTTAVALALIRRLHDEEEPK
jgi:multicomponent Na+:H+ antiporter subunit C